MADGTNGPLFFLTAAEHSGDALGAALIRALKRRYPGARFVGVGGQEMKAAGCELLADTVSRSAMLVGAFVTQTFYWLRLLKMIRREMALRRPAVVIPIDSSAVNLKIAGVAKGLGLKVCYMVAPQVWASRPGRIRKIRARVDALCCLFPFEEAYFKERGVNAVYVGHPLFDAVPGPAGAADEADPLLLDPPLPGVVAASAVTLPAEGGAHRLTGSPAAADSNGKRPLFRVAVFPGSRKAEIARHMPRLLEILSEIKGKMTPDEVAFVAVAPSEERAWQMRRHLRGANVPVDVRVGSAGAAGGSVADSVIRWADLVIAKSGTVTLQIAKHGKPMVVIFAVPWWQWAVAKHFILTRHIALVNILAGKEVVPEFVPMPRSPLPVANVCVALLRDEQARAALAERVSAVVHLLRLTEAQAGGGAALGAADRAARVVATCVEPGHR